MHIDPLDLWLTDRELSDKILKIFTAEPTAALPVGEIRSRLHDSCDKAFFRHQVARTIWRLVNDGSLKVESALVKLATDR